MPGHGIREASGILYFHTVIVPDSKASGCFSAHSCGSLARAQTLGLSRQGCGSAERTCLAQCGPGNDKRPAELLLQALPIMVGAAGFELATLCSQSRCATRLRYAPTARILTREISGSGQMRAFFDFFAATASDQGSIGSAVMHPGAMQTAATGKDSTNQLTRKHNGEPATRKQPPSWPPAGVHQRLDGPGPRPARWRKVMRPLERS